MSNYREIEIIVNVIGNENIWTNEPEGICCLPMKIRISELVTLNDVAGEIRKRVLAIEDVL